MGCYGQRCLIAPLVLIVGGVLGCSSPSPDVPEPTVAAAPAPGATPESGQVLESVEGYQLGPGDRIRLTVFRHEDLSGEFELDGEGVFAMPLVGETPAMNRTARELETELEAELEEQGYLVDPQISVEVLNYRPFYIIGEVNNPGSYPYVNGMNIVNAVALAGGFTYRAAQDDIVISRGGSNGQEIEGSPASQVLPGDIIEVPERFF